MRQRTCTICGTPFEPRHARLSRCPRHEPTRDQRGPTTRAQRDGTGDYDRNRVIVLAGNPMCAHRCGRRATTADHRIAVANGGTNELANLQPSCAWCNSSKQARTDWLPPPH